MQALQVQRLGEILDPRELGKCLPLNYTVQRLSVRIFLKSSNILNISPRGGHIDYLFDRDKLLNDCTRNLMQCFF